METSSKKHLRQRVLIKHGGPGVLGFFVPELRVERTDSCKYIYGRV